MDDLLRRLPVSVITLPTPFPVGPVNVYVVHDDAVILFDTGPKSDEAYTGLVVGLRALGLTVKDLDMIVATHGHIDHVGLLRRLVEESGATTYGHPFVVSQWTYSEEKSVWRRAYFTELFRSYGAPEDETVRCVEHWNSFRKYTDEVTLDHSIDDGDVLAGFKAHHLPGHSPSDTVFVDEVRGFALTGDHVLPDISPNPLIRKPLPGKPKVKSLIEYRDSLKRCRELELGVCCPGHGDAFTNHRAIIDGLLRRHDRRTAQIAGFLEDRPMTPYEVSRALFPRLETNYLYLGISAAIGHLEILEEEGRAIMEDRDGIVLFRTAH